MNKAVDGGPLSPLFAWITRRPRHALCLSLLILLVPLPFLADLVKDTRSDAFLADDNPALVYKDKISAAFGLNDPVVLAVVDESAAGIYRPQTLRLIEELTAGIRELPNINRERVTSLATERNIRAQGDDIDIRPFLEPFPETAEALADLREAVSNVELYSGTLVSADGQMALVTAEMIDENEAERTYRLLHQLVEEATTPPGVQLHLAGEGVIAGYLGAYIDSDALRLNPLAGLIINLTIFLAFLRISPALLSNVIIVASVGITLAVMALLDIAFFVITNALPVILIGISVADAIHIYSEYYALRRQRPEAAVESVVRETMANMWRPITLTTITTMCGFMGLYLAAIMPPFKYFGLFATLGVFIAWLFSMLFLPAALVLTRPQPRSTRHGGVDGFARIANGLGQASLRHARVTLALAVAVAAYGLWAASKLQIEEDRIDLFHPAEAIYQADKAINRHMDGTSVLYIVVESPRRDGLLDPDTLRSIAALQHYALSLPNVGGTSSIVDYLEQMHGILDPDAAKVAALPDTAEAVAQYLFVYSALADPTDFEEEIDYEYRNALVRVSLKHGSYLSIKPVVEALQTYIDTSFTQQDLAVTLSGRVSLNYHWFKDLGRSHFAGLALALLLVWATTALLFRSPLAGLFALVPVGGSVLLVYASMVTLGMNLGIGSSMFAAVAIGLGVDFSIHTLDRLRQLHALHGGATHLVYAEFFHTTGRALLFNFLAITCGFGVLISSKIVSLNQFGSIVVLAVSTSFIASITVLPALVKVGKPNFIVQPGSTKPVFDSGPSALALAALAVTLALLVVPTQGRAAQELTAQAVVARINAVPDGEQVTRRLTITMTDRTGRERRQSSISYRKQAGDDRKTVMFFEEPANIRGTGFLIWNYADAERDDDQWLYLPALRKARRVSTADRGGYFLGTDFTYEDMKLDGKLEPRDYNFKLLPANEGDGASLLLLEAIPRDDAIAEELGYSRIIFGVDTANWILVKAQFFDVRGEPLKTLNASDVRQVDGFWTRHDLRVENHQTGHVTHFLFSDVDYLTPVDDSLFARQSLSRGP